MCGVALSLSSHNENDDQQKIHGLDQIPSPPTQPIDNNNHQLTRPPASPGAGRCANSISFVT